MNNNEALTLPERCAKPRQYGITATMDMGLSLAEQQQILESYSDLLDFVKLGTGSAYINPVLPEKIRLYQQFDIPICLGGTLFEKYYQQNKLDAYQRYLKELGVNWVEISSGVLDIPQQHLLEITSDFQQNFTVVAEVGKKFCHTGADHWLEDIQQYLNLGVRYVILEGRNTADAGIYTTQGELERTLIDQITKQIDAKKLLFEAPTTKTQIQLIQTLGSNVNLGNIDMHDLIGLEALRVGLRADTFNIPEFSD